MNGTETSVIPRRVLVVEDTADIADSLRELLELEGHHVWVALDGDDAVRKARLLHPDVILCDIGLPGACDGYDVARILRADATLTDVSLIAMTGYSTATDLRRAREAGFDDHLAKPPGMDRLEALLRELPRRR